MKPIFNKDKYLKVLIITSSKQIKVTYIIPSDNGFNVNGNNYLLNPDHIYTSGGFKTVLINDLSAETIDPLNFKSRFNKKEFNSAINSKLIKDIFDSNEDKKLNMTTMLIIGVLAISFIILIYVLKLGGVFGS